MRNPEAKKEDLIATAQASKRRLAALCEVLGMRFLSTVIDDENPQKSPIDLGEPLAPSKDQLSHHSRQ
jgi:hypothetical protein